jgi:hypothetical protein
MNLSSRLHFSFLTLAVPAVLSGTPAQSVQQLATAAIPHLRRKFRTMLRDLQALSKLQHMLRAWQTLKLASSLVS